MVSGPLTRTAGPPTFRIAERTGRRSSKGTVGLASGSTGYKRSCGPIRLVPGDQALRTSRFPSDWSSGCPGRKALRLTVHSDARTGRAPGCRDLATPELHTTGGLDL